MNILAVGAHWDDIEIGCSLSLMRLKNCGAKVYGVVLTHSDYEMDQDKHKRNKKTAYKEGIESFKRIGIINKSITKQPNLRMVYKKEVMQELEAIVNDYSIDMVFTHWFGDHNTDHVATWEISRVAFRNVRNILMYQSNAYFDNVKIFSPQYYWGFSADEYDQKKEILKIHITEWEYRKKRWKREIFDRERFWGYLCGFDYAEAFMVSRLLNSQILNY